MRTCYSTFIIALVCFNFSHAQNFDADSVYYTPIPKPGQTTNKRLVHGQDNLKTIVKNRPEYFHTVQTGALIGCNNCESGKDISFTSSIVNGFTIKKKLRVGLGVGVDSYVGWVTMPVFGSLSWDLFGNKSRNALFLQLNYGGSKAWNLKPYQGYGFDNAKGGQMFCPQIGYRIRSSNLTIAFTVGAKVQRVYSYYEYPTWYWVNDGFRQGTNFTTITQDMKRFTATIAVGWK